MRLRSPAGQLAATLLLGALGAGLVILATRQGWARVVTHPPQPLPASRVSVTGSGLVPYANALAVAGLATLAAVLASRRLLRRLAGLLLALLGGVLAVSAFTVSAADAISAATTSASAGPASASAGSVMDGGAVRGAAGATAAVPNVAGTASHVTFSAGAWQALVLAGALAMIVAGLLTAWRATRMAVMSSRYDSPAGSPRQAGRSTTDRARMDSASMWEALSRGDDPTSAGSGAGSSTVRS